MSPRASHPASTVITRLTPCGISETTLRRWSKHARRRIGLPGVVNVVIVPPDLSRRLNSAYRHRRRPTNVLSFHYPTPRHRLVREELPRGDVILCPTVIRREASAQRRPYRTYFRYLLEHGLIHLLGLDHATAAEQRRWDRLELLLQ